MKYILARDYRVNFKAYAPMHTFKGWCTKGVKAEMEIDFNALSLHKLVAVAKVSHFTTGDGARTLAMANYMMVNRFPKASIEMTKCNSFQKLKKGAYRISVVTLLEFMGIQRQLPIIFYAVPTNDGIKIEVAFRWSFKAFGLKAPRLFFLTVRDIVDIKGWGKFTTLKLPPHPPNNSKQNEAVPA